MSDEAERITAYLMGGGLFNPELANHEVVRDLLIDCRAALAAAPAQPDTHMQELAAYRLTVDNQEREIAELKDGLQEATHMEMAANAEASRVDELTEMRKQDTALIRQLVDALQRSTKFNDADFEALAAGRARLESISAESFSRKDAP